MKISIRKHYFILFAIFILLFSIILRFVHYPNRWGLAYDQSHDALVARYALQSWKLPLLGPFSSAGPFQTGGEWYWLIMLGTILYPPAVIAPWVFMTALSIVFIVILMFAAKELINEKYAIIAGLLAAISPAEITQSTNMTNQTPIALFAVLAIWSLVRFLHTNKKIYLFLLGLSVSTAASIHLQGMALGAMIIILFLFLGKPKIENLVFVIVGLCLPWIPVLISDLHHNFFNFRNFIQYYLHDQYKISLDVLGRRWSTYLGSIVPHMWSFIFGGNILIGYLSIFASVFIGFFFLWKRKISKVWLVLGISFILMLGIVRYTRTPLFESFLVFWHPFILLFTAAIVYILFDKKKIFGVSILFLVVFFSLQTDIHEISLASNNTASKSQQLLSGLRMKYPHKKIILYDYKQTTRDSIYPLVLYLSVENPQAPIKRIGMIATSEASLKYTVINRHDSSLFFVDLDALSTETLQREGWSLISPETVYHNTEEWYK